MLWVIVAHHKHVGFIPVVDEQVNQLVLYTAGILVFIHQYILEFFLVGRKQVPVLFRPGSPS